MLDDEEDEEISNIEDCLYNNGNRTESNIISDVVI